MQQITLAKNDSEDHQSLKFQSNLAMEYAELNWKKYDDYIAEFPVEEGYSSDSKRGAVFTIVREFLEWCAERDDSEPPEIKYDF